MPCYMNVKRYSATFATFYPKTLTVHPENNHAAANRDAFAPIRNARQRSVREGLPSGLDLRRRLRLRVVLEYAQMQPEVV